MSKINDGGSAFPLAYVEKNEYGVEFPSAILGMTLRDWFAGLAMRARWGDGSPMSAEDAAQFAYQLADAMLAAREVK